MTTRPFYQCEYVWISNPNGHGDHCANYDQIERRITQLATAQLRIHVSLATIEMLCKKAIRVCSYFPPDFIVIEVNSQQGQKTVRNLPSISVLSVIYSKANNTTGGYYYRLEQHKMTNLQLNPPVRSILNTSLRIKLNSYTTRSLRAPDSYIHV